MVWRFTLMNAHIHEHSSYLQREDVQRNERVGGVGGEGRLYAGYKGLGH